MGYIPSSKRLIILITRLYSPHHTSRILSSNSEVLKRHQTLVTQSSGYRYLSNYTRMQNCYNTHRRRWILGILLTIAFPFAGNKWGQLLKIKNEVDTTVETIDEIVEVVKEVAEVVDKVAEDISGDLPDGGKLKRVLDVVEYVAEETAENARAIEDAIDKFQEMEKKVENIAGTPNDAK